MADDVANEDCKLGYGVPRIRALLNEDLPANSAAVTFPSPEQCRVRPLLARTLSQDSGKLDL